MFARYSVSRSRINIMSHLPEDEGFAILPKELPVDSRSVIKTQRQEALLKPLKRSKKPITGVQ